MKIFFLELLHAIINMHQLVAHGYKAEHNLTR